MASKKTIEEFNASMVRIQDCAITMSDAIDTKYTTGEASVALFLLQHLMEKRQPGILKSAKTTFELINEVAEGMGRSGT